jgi:hypothetical protein
LELRKVDNEREKDKLSKITVRKNESVMQSYLITFSTEIDMDIFMETVKILVRCREKFIAERTFQEVLTVLIPIES